MGNYLKKNRTADARKKNGEKELPTSSEPRRKGKADGNASDHFLSYNIALLGESISDKSSFLKRYTMSLESLDSRSADDAKIVRRGVRCTRVSRRGCKHRQTFLVFPASSDQHYSEKETVHMCSKSSAIILLYSIFLRESFVNVIQQWEHGLGQLALEKSKGGFCVLLVGLSDAKREKSQRQVTTNEASDLSGKKNWDFFEMSLRNKQNVFRVLGTLAKRVEFVDSIRRRLE